ncbi:MAG: c-type cytochrome [Pedosphaera sp.]|nr:c-type cytochrome [Pedosphaera sp.]
MSGSASGSGLRQSAWAEYVEADFPFFSSVLDARTLGTGVLSNNITPRGILLNLGHGCWACFDTDLLRMSALWTGQGVTPVSMSQCSYHVAGAKAPEGQEDLPKPLGTPWLANGIYPGWQMGEIFSLNDPRESGPDPREVGRGLLPGSAGQFKSIHLVQGGVRLEYDVAGVSVKEWPAAQLEQGLPVVQRRFRLDPVPHPLWLILGCRLLNANESFKAVLTPGQVAGQTVAEIIEKADGLLAVRVYPSEKPVEFQVALGMGIDVTPWGPSGDDRAQKPSPARWAQAIPLRAMLAAEKDAYGVDNIPLPLENPWKRNVRLADLAFFKDGRAAAVTFDGDVWIISGLVGELRSVSWRRFTSGLHEPLGLCVRGDDLFVVDRNGIWRLRDTDGNGEADVHELFSNAFAQTAETREFAAGIRLAPDGSFVIAKGGQQGSTIGKHNGSVLRVSPDGKSATVLGRGLRQPLIGVNPKTGLVTASDQQGHYVPATPLHVIQGGQYYGYIPLILPKEKYPAAIADPLTWIPHPINASGAGQVWLHDVGMGPLNGALIHLGYYRPELFVVLLNERASRMQAAVVSLTRNLEFAPLAGAVNPIDGQLYVAGFQIFGTVAKQISGLARVRYTGAPCMLPHDVLPMEQGILLRFNVVLDAKKARDPVNYSVERWNYTRTASYGSPHFRLDGSKGQESMVPSSAYLSADGKSVFLGIADMKSVMQMRLGWALATREGLRFEQNTYFTPYELTQFDSAAEGFGPLTIDLMPRKAPGGIALAPASAEEGGRVSELMGCVACHSADGSTIGRVGPTWKGLYGSPRVFVDRSKALADEAYLRESIWEPSRRVVTGFEKSDTGMPSYEGVLSEGQIESLVLYIKSLR